MRIGRQWQVACMMAIGLLAVPLHGQTQTQEPPEAGQGQRAQRPRAEREPADQASRPRLTDRQRSLLSDISGAIHAVANSVKDSVVHIEVTEVSGKAGGGRIVPAPGGRGGQDGNDEDNDQGSSGGRGSQTPDDLREQLRRFFGGQLPPGLEMPDEGGLPERVRRGLGSGIVYDDKGHILTNNHVVGGAENIRVVTTDGREFSAKVVGADPLTDVAVIQVKTSELTPAQFGDSTKMEVGDLCLAVGNPFSLDYSVTLGIISAIGRSGLQLGSIYYQDFIQTDAAINPGNSGGPLLNIEGQVIGINTAISSPSGGSVGIGFAVPVSAIEQVVPELLTYGRYRHPSLGVEVRELGYQVQPTTEGPQHGLLIVGLDPGGAAAQAGLEAAQVRQQGRRLVFVGGDIIVAVDGQPLATRDDLTLYLESNKRPGDPASLTVIRAGKQREVQLTVGEM